MTRRTIVASFFAIMAALVLFAQPALALPDTRAVYDPSTQSIKLGISGGDQDFEYTIHLAAFGCIDVTLDSLYLIGPEDSASVVVTCQEADSSGRVLISYCTDGPCFDTRVIYFTCRENCDVYSAGSIPALSEWGIIALVLLMVSSAVWIFRKKRVTAH